MSETTDQIALFDLLRRLEGLYPLLQFVAHIPNGEFRAKATAARLKAMGVRRGISDILVFCMNRGPIEGQPAYYYTGLAIERKSARGVVSDDQQRWLAQLSCEGWYTAVSTDWAAEARLILTWVGADVTTVERL